MSLSACDSTRNPRSATHVLCVPRLAGGLVGAGVKEIEKVSHGRRLFCEALLFSWRDYRPGLEPP